jgi:hypothetical protein
MRVFRVVMALALFICLLPLLSMAVAQFIAEVNGCKLDLASAHPCMVGSSDMGHTLLTLGMMGYFLFATLPVVAVIVISWVAVEVIAWAQARGARST